MHSKGNKCPRCKSVFASEKSANDQYRRNLRRKSCAKARGPDVSNVSFKEDPRRVRPRTDEKEEERGSARSKSFLESLDSRIREIAGETQPGSTRGTRKRSWRPWSRHQVITKAKIRERASPTQWVREE